MTELLYYDLKKTANMTPSLPVQVARELGRRIVAGHLAANTIIEDENSLSERYKVSRIVIREAVKLLVAKGMLEVRRGIGTKVLPRSQWSLFDDDVLAWHLSAPPQEEFLSQLMEMRLAIEPKAARWAAQRATTEDLEEIAEAIDRMERDQGTAQEFIIADALFHQAMLKAAHNEFLKGFEGVIYSALLVSVRITNKDPIKNGASIPFHRNIYEAIAARQPEKAEELTEHLLSDAKRRLRSEHDGQD